jgi:tetratricopeptide (TPR) repeat protein
MPTLESLVELVLCDALADVEPPPPTGLAADADGHEARLHELMGTAHTAIADQDLDAAERALVATLDLDETFRPAHALFALILEKLGELTDARLAYQWALRLADGVDELSGLARVSARLGDRSEARAALARAVLQVTDTASAVRIGLSGLVVGDHVLARAVLSELVEESVAPEPCLGLALSYACEGARDLAERHLREAETRAEFCHNSRVLARCRMAASVFAMSSEPTSPSAG